MASRAAKNLIYSLIGGVKKTIRTVRDKTVTALKNEDYRNWEADRASGKGGYYDSIFKVRDRR